MALEVVIDIGVSLAGGGLVGALIHARAKNRKLTAEASHLGAEDVKVLVADTAMRLMKTLKEELEEAQQECKDLKDKLSEMSKEVEHLRTELEAERHASNAMVLKLESANRRVAAYQSLIEDRPHGSKENP